MYSKRKWYFIKQNIRLFCGTLSYFKKFGIVNGTLCLNHYSKAAE
jgi:hypothetical protein